MMYMYDDDNQDVQCAITVCLLILNMNIYISTIEPPWPYISTSLYCYFWESEMRTNSNRYMFICNVVAKFLFLSFLTLHLKLEVVSSIPASNMSIEWKLLCKIPGGLNTHFRTPSD